MENANLIFSRRSKFYSANIATWKRTLAAYSGGRKYIRMALIPHAAENKLEFAERIRRGIYLNFPRKIASMITEFLFASEPDRDGAFEPVLEDFSMTGMNANYVMMQAEVINLLFGLSWVLVDMPSVPGKIDMETKQTQRIYPFARALMPMQVPDWAYGADGKLLWAVVEERFERKDTPLKEPVDVVQRRVWYRDRWELYEKSDRDITMVASAPHNLGCVPLVKWQEATGYGLSHAHWFEDIIGISDAVLNALSESEMNIIKQMFGMLVVSRSFAECNGEVNPDPKEGESEAQAKARCQQEKESYRQELSRTSALWEDAALQESGLTRYISPSGAETEAILNWIKFLRESMTDILRLALQSSIKAAQTAESKEWDSNNAVKFLSARALALEEIETQVWEIMNRWDQEIKVPKVSYGRDFSINDIKTATECLMDISSFDAGEEFTRAVYDKALVLLDRIDRLPQSQYEKIKNEIEQMKIEKPQLPEMMSVDDLLKGKSTIKGKGKNENFGNPEKDQ